MAEPGEKQPGPGPQPGSVPEAYLEDLCFLAQQAAEKAVKALLIERGIDFPYVHDLGRLLFLLDEEGEEVPEEIRAAAELTLYASVTRYPGVMRPVTVEEYSEATEIAEPARLRLPYAVVSSWNRIAGKGHKRAARPRLPGDEAAVAPEALRAAYLGVERRVRCAGFDGHPPGHGPA